MKNFQNKKVVITGAGSGIGRALAVAFERHGAQLILNDHSEEGLAETVALLTNVLHYQVFDVSDQEAVFAFADTIKARFGCVDVLINNAGVSGSADPAYLTPISTYQRVMDINFFGVLYGCQAFIPQFIENNAGAIVNISSVYGLIGSPSNTDYCASKFAVRGYTEALSIEFHKSPISIHCVHPGGINTNITASRMGNNDTTEFAQKFLTTKPEDMARRIIEGIAKNKPRIVYGNQSFTAFLISRFVSKKLQNKLIWKKYEAILPPKDYEPLIAEHSK
jgi:short-subunit dehydrogenase